MSDAPPPAAVDTPDSADAAATPPRTDVTLAPESAAVAHPTGDAGLVNFADVAQSINPAVVNIEATTRNSPAAGRRQPGSGFGAV